MATDGGSAYPYIEKFACNHATVGGCAQSDTLCRNETVYHPGLSRLEVFAMAAMQGLMAECAHPDALDCCPDRIVPEAWRFAEAMLAEAEGRKDGN